MASDILDVINDVAKDMKEKFLSGEKHLTSNVISTQELQKKFSSTNQLLAPIGQKIGIKLIDAFLDGVCPMTTMEKGGKFNRLTFIPTNQLEEPDIDIKKNFDFTDNPIWEYTNEGTQYFFMTVISTLLVYFKKEQNRLKTREFMARKAETSQAMKNLSHPKIEEV